MGTIASLLAIAGMTTLWLALRQLRMRRLIRSGLSTTVALVCLTAGGLLFGLSAAFHAYGRLLEEQPVGTIRFAALGPALYEAELRLQGSPGAQYLRLLGDEWQLDVRFLKWQGPAVLLGFDALYQLDRLSGRFRDPVVQRARGYSVHSLTPDPGDALWRLAKSVERWVPWVDAVYGSATYLPMADGAGYAIAVSSTGVLARPLDAAAREAVAAW